MLNSSAQCVKYILFAFNLIFAITGIAVLGVGATILGVYNNYEHFLDDKFFSAPVFLIIVGVIVFGVSFFGCCGAIKENHCMTMTFAVLLVVIFILELAGGIAGYVLRDKVEAVLEEKFNSTMAKYSGSEEIKEVWDNLQESLHCCGLNGAESWPLVLNTTYQNCAVKSCFISPPNVTDTCVPYKSKAEIYQVGCLDKLSSEIKDNAVTLGGVGVGIAFVELIGVFLSCCLARAIRQHYESV